MSCLQKHTPLEAYLNKKLTKSFFLEPDSPRFTKFLQGSRICSHKKQLNTILQTTVSTSLNSSLLVTIFINYSLHFRFHRSAKPLAQGLLVATVFTTHWASSHNSLATVSRPLATTLWADPSLTRWPDQLTPRVWQGQGESPFHQHTLPAKSLWHSTTTTPEQVYAQLAPQWFKNSIWTFVGKIGKKNHGKIP